MISVRKLNFMSFKNQTVVITGGASGIGLAAAHLIQKNNGTPLLLDMDLKKLNEAQRTLNLTDSIFEVDVSNEKELNNCLDFALEKLPPIKGLVCSAGKAPIPKRIEDTELNEWNSIIESHLTGTFLSCKIFGGQIAKIGGGSIVNISSVVGFNPGPVLANTGLNSLSFQKPVVAGDIITAQITVKRKTRRTEDYGEVRWHVTLRNQDTEQVAEYELLTMNSYGGAKGV